MVYGNIVFNPAETLTGENRKVVKVSQDNLDRTRQASAEMGMWFEEKKVDVAFLQEPYTNIGKLNKMPDAVMTIQSQDNNPMLNIVI